MLKICIIPNCENFKGLKPPIFIMAELATPNKQAEPDLTYIECSWAFSESASLYVRLSPAVAQALKLKPSVHFKKLGKVDRVSFTKKLKSKEAKHAFCFKFDVDTSVEGESQDVDVSSNVVYAFKEEKFSDFSEDTACKRLFANKWKPQRQLLAAHKQAMKDKALKKNGDWLKKTFKTDVVATQSPQVATGSVHPPEPLTNVVVPEAFAFKPNVDKQQKGKKTSVVAKPKGGKRNVDKVDSSDDNESCPESPEVLSTASQRVQGT